ncbi:protease-4 [Parelusimicrobium proximum]|uniref:signal peptide peptidase SppA n=1 Tax=Parelusimicrobium proximum TaxID=3228953 RepID=UPI003D167899
MEDNNQNQNPEQLNQENQPAPAPAENNAEKTIPPMHIEEAKEKEAPSPDVSGQKNAKGFSTKWWFMACAVLFLLASVCALTITFKGGAAQKCDSSAKDSSSGSFTSSFSGSVFAKNNESAIAVVKIRGVIMEDQGGSGWGNPPSASAIAKRIKTLSERENVKAIILDINSPGGTVASVQEIYYEIKAAREKGKKVIALFRDTAASGAYYIAMACDKVIAQPGTVTGSIGVIMQGSNLQGLMQKIGVEFVTIKSGEHKDMGSPFREMTTEEKALLQGLIDDSYNQFFEVVKESRKDINLNTLKIYADGRVFTGRQAFSIGLIDGLGGEEEAIKAARELTGIADLKLMPTRPSSFSDFFQVLEFGSSTNALGFTKTLDSAASGPRLSYMWVM